MKNFKAFLNEYITNGQRASLETVLKNKRSGFPLDDKGIITAHGRANTDHFFGIGVDRKTEYLPQSTQDKSETHRKVEEYLGREIPHEDYKKGLVQDPKYPKRKIKISGLLEPKIQAEFVKERAGARATAFKGNEYVTIHRGLEVGGQTNSEPNESHPSGHSWGGESCKNIGDDSLSGPNKGSNSKFLPHEIRAGSVVAFIHHPETGQELARATFHPHYDVENKDVVGNVLFDVNSVYGIKKPEYLEHFKTIAARLSHGGKTLNDAKFRQYEIDDGVYNNGVEDRRYSLHTDDPAKIAEMYHANKDKDIEADVFADDEKGETYYKHLIEAVASHEKTPSDVLYHIIESDKKLGAVSLAASNPALSHKHINALIDPSAATSEDALYSLGKNKNLTGEQITQVLKNKKLGAHTKSSYVANTAFTNKHIDDILENKDNEYTNLTLPLTRSRIIRSDQLETLIEKHKNNPASKNAFSNSNLHHDVIDKHINGSDYDTLESISRNPNLSPKHIKQILDNPSLKSKMMLKNSMLSYHPNVNEDVINHAIDNASHNETYSWILNNNKATKENLDNLISKGGINGEIAALKHSKVSPEQISNFIENGKSHHHEAIVSNDSLTDEHVNSILNSPTVNNTNKRELLENNKNITDAHLNHVLNNQKDFHPSLVMIAKNRKQRRERDNT